MKNEAVVDFLKSFRVLRTLRRGIRALQDYIHFQPRPWYRRREIRRGRFNSHAVAQALQKNGICILENYLEEGRLRSVQAAARDIFEDLPMDPETPAALRCHIDCGLGGPWADLILDELILSAIEEYYGRPLHLAVAQCQRLHSVKPYDGRAFQWHHDCKGKQVKAMWLLADVPADGQRMSYVAGSHKLRHSFSQYSETRFSEDQARQHGPVIECAGPAGSVVIFDTNGIHRGNRNWGPIRDTVVGVYSAGRHLLGCSFEASKLGALTNWQRTVLKRSRNPTRPY